MYKLDCIYINNGYDCFYDCKKLKIVSLFDCKECKEYFKDQRKKDRRRFKRREQ